MNNLSYLSLTLSPGNKETFDPGPILHSSRIRHLILYQLASWLQRDDEVVFDDSNFQQFFAVFTIWAPLVETLKVQRLDHIACAIKYAQSLKYLRKLVLMVLEAIVEGVDGTSFSAIEEVHIHSMPSTLTEWSFPSALRLTYHIEQPTELLCRLDPVRWNSLQVLNIDVRDVDWTGVSLPSLKKLTHGNLGVYNITTSALYEEIARHPTSFPCLNYIAARNFPAWDILFIMLERRNFHRDSSISRITTLAFPGLPAQMILKPLTEYLRGRLPITIRLSNYDISIHAIKDSYFDAQM
jgi:hypothetical protein